MTARELTNDLSDSDIGDEKLQDNRLRLRRERIYAKLLTRAQRTRMERRSWFCVSEIADAYAQVQGQLAIDPERRALAIERLREAVLRGDFEDRNNSRSRLTFLHTSPRAKFRFERAWAENLEQWNKWTTFRPSDWDSWNPPKPWPVTIWIRREDCASWFSKQGLAPPKGWGLEEAPSRPDSALLPTDIRPAEVPPTAKDVEEYIEIPPLPPIERGKSRTAYDAMLEKWPNRKIPKQSMQKIANTSNRGLKREDVERALGKRK